MLDVEGGLFEERESSIPFAQSWPNIPAGYQDRVSVANSDSSEILKPMDYDQIQSIVRQAVQNAVDFQEEDITGARTILDKYYQGGTSIAIVPNRSKVTISVVRDSVKSVIASIARIFTQTDTVGEFYSDDEEDERLCKDATRFCNAVFWKADGYRALIMGATDALKARKGIIKVYLEQTPYSSYNAQGQPTQKIKLKWHLLPVPPEEFIVDSAATCLEDASFCAHRRSVPLSDAIALGYKFEDIVGLTGEDMSTFQTEKDSRRDFSRTLEETAQAGNVLSEPILITEIYMKLDIDGDGLAELYRIDCAGLNYEVQAYEPVNWLPFAEISAELQPHVFYPLCLADDLTQDQDAQTALLRSIIDNTALVNSPRTEVNESKVNLNDLQSGAIGALVRVRQMGQINELVTPFVAGQTLPVLQHLQDVSQSRSGVTKLSQGLDADQLQSTTRVAAQAAVSAADARIEMMARNIGETGVKSLFLCILRTAIHTIKGDTQIKAPEGFMTIRPEWWHDQISVKVNVGLGSGRIDEKKQTLTSLIALQQQIVLKYGIANPICSWTNMRNTIASLLRLSGVHNTTDYFPYVSPELQQQLDQQEKQSSQAAQQMQVQQLQAQLSVGQQIAQAEQVKAQAAMASVQQKAQAEIQKLQAQIMELKAKQTADMSAELLKDDRERDNMQLDFITKAAELNLKKKEIDELAKQADTQAAESKLSA